MTARQPTNFTMKHRWVSGTEDTIRNEQSTRSRRQPTGFTMKHRWVSETYSTMQHRSTGQNIVAPTYVPTVTPQPSPNDPPPKLKDDQSILNIIKDMNCVACGTLPTYFTTCCNTHVLCSNCYTYISRFGNISKCENCNSTPMRYYKSLNIKNLLEE